MYFVTEEMTNSLSEYDAYCHSLKYELHPLFPHAIYITFTYIVHDVVALIDSLD